MRLFAGAMREWLPRAPRWSARLLALLIVADAVQAGLQLRAAARTDLPRAAPLARLAVPDAQQIAAAHLFGADSPVEHRTATGAAERAQWVLSGVIATSDPNEGYAILGEQGKPTRVYRTGTALGDSSAAVLYQVFADRVVVDVAGRQETLILPRQPLHPSGVPRLARFDAADGANAIPPPMSARAEPPSAAEGWFSNLYVERYDTDGKTGVRLHPAMRFQRRYGLREGDTLTAVDGVPVGDQTGIDRVLRAGGTTIALTLKRDGVEETMRLPLEQ
ncbi:MAG: hypothetical protein JOZ92_04495 [Candidatus Dormibacteraeota bacterium]|nr:hypothetical protein [Candidatus Dormibacteraeota bacterium]